MKDVYVLAYGRSPIGSLMGSYLTLDAVDLTAQVMKKVLDRQNIPVDQIDELILGNVLSANLGQAPATQIARKAGLPDNVPCTLVNKVCSSGMKSIMFGAQSIQLGLNELVITGGFEHMTNVPHYLPNHRSGQKFGNTTLVDALVKDGLQDPYDGQMMGNCAEHCAEEHKISRLTQDEYAFESYHRARLASDIGVFDYEIVPIDVPTRKGGFRMLKDEELSNKRITHFEDLSGMRTVFKKDGTVTAGNASKLNDGACIVVLGTLDKAKSLGLTPIAKVCSMADAATAPIDFTIAPSMAIPKALSRANLSLQDVELYEINEAFAVVALANAHRLKLDLDFVNISGGAVSMGHPLGMSGARMVTTLLSSLKFHNRTKGVSAICNGGGGASAMVLEMV